MKKYNQICQRTLPGKGIFLVLIIMIVIGGCIRNNKESRRTAEAMPIPDSIYMSEGNKIVALTFDTLRKSLLHAISSQGIDGAIRFCNENGYSLISTYADSVTVRRTALRYRNPGNSPDSLEQVVLDEMTATIKSGGVYDARVIRRPSSGEVHFFKPILLQPMCLNCHGTPGKQIQPATLTSIQNLYPNDRAINFSQGDLRGAWHVTFKSQKE